MTAVQTVAGIPGCVVSVTLDGQPLTPDEHGFLGRLTGNQRVLLGAQLKLEAPIVALFINDNKRGPRQVRELTEISHASTEVREYELKVAVQPGDDDQSPYVKSGQNSLTLAERLPGCLIRLHEIAIASHNGDFFLTHQTNDHQAYLKRSHPEWTPEAKEYPVVPELRRWLFAKGLLNLILGEELHSLPPYPDNLVRSLPSVADLREDQARVAFWSDAKGLGAVVTPKLPDLVRIHRDHLARDPGQLASLRTGDILSYTAVTHVPSDSVKQHIIYQLIGARVVRP